MAGSVSGVGLLGNRSVSPDIGNATSSAMQPELTTLMTTTTEQSLKDRLLLLTKEQKELAEEVLLMIRYVFYALALPATVCNIVVFLQRSLRSATSVYVIGLSVYQLLYIATSIISVIMSESIEDPMNNLGYLIYGIYVSSYLSLTLRRASYLLMCLLSLERLYAVLRPLHVKEFVVTRFPVLFTLLTTAVAAIFHVYMLVKTSIEETVSSRTGKTVYVMKYTALYTQDPTIADGFGSAAPFLLTYIPLLTLIGFNVATVWALRFHNRSAQGVRSSASEDEKRQQERQMTVTILATTMCYVVLSLPYAFHNFFKNLYEEYDKRQKYNNLYYVMRSCAFTLTLLSCIIDFVCFYLLSSAYRKAFYRLLRIKGKDDKLKSKAESSFSQTAGTDVATKY